MSLPTYVTFTDTETSGLDERENEIIQIAAIKVVHRGLSVEIVDELEVKVMPTKPVPPEVAKLNGYSADIWEKKAVSLDDALVKYFRMLTNTNFGGQNPAFDKRFLDEAARKVGLPWPKMAGYRLVAVEILAWPLFLLGKIPNVKQETLAGYFNLGKQTHDALDDVRQSVEIYRKLLPLVAEGFQ